MASHYYEKTTKSSTCFDWRSKNKSFWQIYNYKPGSNFYKNMTSRQWGRESGAAMPLRTPLPYGTAIDRCLSLCASRLVFAPWIVGLTAKPISRSREMMEFVS